jgi:hypothetical protein
MEGTNRHMTAWRKSSHSGNNNGDCVEVGAWRKSSYSASNNGACVEVGGAGPAVVVRDTKDRAGAVLAFGAQAWSRFAATVKSVA